MKGLLFLFLGVLVSSAYGAAPYESRIRVGFAGYPISNLYYLGFDDYSEAVTSLVLEPLVRLNLDSLEPEPSLANWFSVNRDHTQFEFTLDPKAKFSDDSPVTSEDVLFTWNILKSSANQVQAYASLFMDLTDCQISQGKIIFSSKRPVPLGMTLFPSFMFFQKNIFLLEHLPKISMNDL